MYFFLQGEKKVLEPFPALKLNTVKITFSLSNRVKFSLNIDLIIFNRIFKIILQTKIVNERP